MGLRLRAVIFCFFALLIGVGPFFPQVMNTGSPWLRPWVMYAGVGVGVLKGDFTATYADGSSSTLTPLEILNLENYHKLRVFRYSHRVYNEVDLRRVVSPWCAAQSGQLSDLAFRGKVGLGRGWADVDVSGLCEAVTAKIGGDNEGV